MVPQFDVLQAKPAGITRRPTVCPKPPGRTPGPPLEKPGPQPVAPLNTMRSGLAGLKRKSMNLQVMRVKPVPAAAWRFKRLILSRSRPESRQSRLARRDGVGAGESGSGQKMGAVDAVACQPSAPFPRSAL